MESDVLAKLGIPGENSADIGKEICSLISQLCDSGYSSTDATATEKSLSLKLILLSKIRPTAFAQDMVVHRLLALFKKSHQGGISYGRSPPTFPILASSLLLRAFADVSSWPLEFVKLYLEDALGPRCWVDRSEVVDFVRNIETAFSCHEPDASPVETTKDSSKEAPDSSQKLSNTEEIVEPKESQGIKEETGSAVPVSTAPAPAPEEEEVLDEFVFGADEVVEEELGTIALSPGSPQGKTAVPYEQDGAGMSPQHESSAELPSFLDSRHVPVRRRYPPSVLPQVRELFLQAVEPRVAAGFDTHTHRALIAACTVAMSLPEARAIAGRWMEVWLAGPLVRPAKVALERLGDVAVEEEILLALLRIKMKASYNVWVLDAILKIMRRVRAYETVVLRHYVSMDDPRFFIKTGGTNPLVTVFRSIRDSGQSPLEADGELALVLQELAANITNFQTQAIRVVRLLQDEFDPLVLCQGVMQPRPEMLQLDASIRSEWLLKLCDLLTIVLLVSGGSLLLRKGGEAVRDVLLLGARVQCQATHWCRTVLQLYLEGVERKEEELWRYLCRIHFIDRDHSYFPRGDHPFDVERRALEMMCTKLPVFQDTLRSLIILAKHHESLPAPVTTDKDTCPKVALPPGRGLFLIERLVCRAVSCQQVYHDAFPACVHVSDTSLVDELFSLTRFVLPPAAREKLTHCPNLALSQSFWQVCIILTLLSAFNPSSVGATCWGSFPTMHMIMEMFVTAVFTFPPPASSIDLLKSDEALSIVEGNVASEASVAMRAKAGEVNLHGVIMVFAPKRDARMPPPEIVSAFQRMDSDFHVGHRLRHADGCPFLLEILQRELSHPPQTHGRIPTDSSMPDSSSLLSTGQRMGFDGCVRWLSPLLAADQGLAQSWPPKLCSEIVVHLFRARDSNLRSLLLPLSVAVTNPQRDDATEAIQYLVGLLSSSRKDATMMRMLFPLILQPPPLQDLQGPISSWAQTASAKSTSSTSMWLDTLWHHIYSRGDTGLLTECATLFSQALLLEDRSSVSATYVTRILMRYIPETFRVPQKSLEVSELADESWLDACRISLSVLSLCERRPMLFECLLLELEVAPFLLSSAVALLRLLTRGEFGCDSVLIQDDAVKTVTVLGLGGSQEKVQLPRPLLRSCVHLLALYPISGDKDKSVEACQREILDLILPKDTAVVVVEDGLPQTEWGKALSTHDLSLILNSPYSAVGDLTRTLPAITSHGAIQILSGLNSSDAGSAILVEYVISHPEETTKLFSTFGSHQLRRLLPRVASHFRTASHRESLLSIFRSSSSGPCATALDTLFDLFSAQLSSAGIERTAAGQRTEGGDAAMEDNVASVGAAVRVGLGERGGGSAPAAGDVSMADGEAITQVVVSQSDTRQQPFVPTTLGDSDANQRTAATRLAADEPTQPVPEEFKHLSAKECMEVFVAGGARALSISRYLSPLLAADVKSAVALLSTPPSLRSARANESSYDPSRYQIGAQLFQEFISAVLDAVASAPSPRYTAANNTAAIDVTGPADSSCTLGTVSEDGDVCVNISSASPTDVTSRVRLWSHVGKLAAASFVLRGCLSRANEKPSTRALLPFPRQYASLTDTCLRATARAHSPSHDFQLVSSGCVISVWNMLLLYVDPSLSSNKALYFTLTHALPPGVGVWRAPYRSTNARRSRVRNVSLKGTCLESSSARRASRTLPDCRSISFRSRGDWLAASEKRDDRHVCADVVRHVIRLCSWRQLEDVVHVCMASAGRVFFPGETTSEPARVSGSAHEAASRLLQLITPLSLSDRPRVGLVDRDDRALWGAIEVVPGCGTRTSVLCVAAAVHYALCHLAASGPPNKLAHHNKGAGPSGCVPDASECVSRPGGRTDKDLRKWELLALLHDVVLQNVDSGQDARSRAASTSVSPHGCGRPVTDVTDAVVDWLCCKIFPNRFHATLFATHVPAANEHNSDCNGPVSVCVAKEMLSCLCVALPVCRTRVMTWINKGVFELRTAIAVPTWQHGQIDTVMHKAVSLLMRSDGAGVTPAYLFLRRTAATHPHIAARVVDTLAAILSGAQITEATLHDFVETPAPGFGLAMFLHVLSFVEPTLCLLEGSGVEARAHCASVLQLLRPYLDVLRATTSYERSLTLFLRTLLRVCISVADKSKDLSFLIAVKSHIRSLSKAYNLPEIDDVLSLLDGTGFRRKKEDSLIVPARNVILCAAHSCVSSPAQGALLLHEAGISPSEVDREMDVFSSSDIERHLMVLATAVSQSAGLTDALVRTCELPMDSKRGAKEAAMIEYAMLASSLLFHSSSAVVSAASRDAILAILHKYPSTGHMAAQTFSRVLLAHTLRAEEIPNRFASLSHFALDDAILRVLLPNGSRHVAMKGANIDFWENMGSLSAELYLMSPECAVPLSGALFSAGGQSIASLHRILRTADLLWH
eukprot:Rmarinus@m.10691